jgi:TPR repeat protein
MRLLQARLVLHALLTVGITGALVLPTPAEAASKKKKKGKKKKGGKEGALSANCDDDDGESCGLLAEMLLDAGDVREKSARRAVALLERGCELKDPGSCSRLARELDRGLWLKKDPARMAELAGKGCNLGDIPSCVVLGVSYLNGNGVEQSFEKAVPHLKHACKEDDGDGCLQMGLMILEGKGAPPDPSRAEGFLEKACDLESGAGCARLGQMHYTGIAPAAGGGAAGQPNFKKAATYFTSGCDLDSADACTALGKMRMGGQGMGMDEDVAKELFEKACGLGDAWACVESGAAPDDGTVIELMRKRCDDEKDVRACFGVGAAWLKDEDQKRAESGATYLQAACDGGVPRACHKLALALDKGEVLTKDLKRSQALFQKACQAGYKKSCGR